MSYKPEQAIIDAVLAAVYDQIYPVGTIYTSVDNTDPGTLFGGTWAAFGSGKTLIGVDSGDTDFDAVEETGGAKTKAISAHAGTAIADHPAHTHSVTSNVSVDNHTFTQPTVAWPAGVPTASGTAVADHAAHTHSVTSNVAVSDHAAHTHSVTSNVAVSDHASHTHTYTDVPNHVHVQNVNTGTTGAQNGYGVDTSTSGSGATGISTANPTGGVATGTTAGPNAALSHSVTNNAVTSGNPSATLTHSVTNNAVTSGNPSATLTHSVTQPTIAWPAGVPTNSGGAVNAHTVNNPAVTSGNPSATLSHSVTQPNDHAALNVVQPYITVYFFKRTS